MTTKQSKRRWAVLPRALLLTLTLAGLLLAVGLPARADTPVRVTLNGEGFSPAFARNGVTYVPVRAFADAVGGASVIWDGATESAGVVTDYLSLTVYNNKSYVIANGRCIWRDALTLPINGTLYAPLTVLAAAYGGQVHWDQRSSTASVSGAGQAIASSDAVYDTEELTWLARIIEAEARGEPFNGKLAVGNVILNRVACPEFPNSIYQVIFDRKWGVQFSPTADGSIYNSPSTESYIAAKAALEGYSLSDSILYFLNPRIAQSFWITANRPFAFTIGNHDFYR